MKILELRAQFSRRLWGLVLLGACFGSAVLLARKSGIASKLQAAPSASARASQATAGIQFTEVAKEAGVTAPNVWGGITEKKYILETKGNGVAFFDYDRDGWLDVYLSNGTRLEGFPSGQEPTNHLYHNNHDGTFTDVTARAGLARTGWQTGVCVGDYDNDGWGGSRVPESGCQPDHYDPGSFWHRPYRAPRIRPTE